MFITSRHLRGKIHSSLGGRKAYLNFELKDHDRRGPRAFGASLTSKFRYARVSRAMNGMEWPVQYLEAPFHLGLSKAENQVVVIPAPW